jgi:hypothetical protein
MPKLEIRVSAIEGHARIYETTDTQVGVGAIAYNSKDARPFQARPLDVLPPQSFSALAVAELYLLTAASELRAEG